VDSSQLTTGLERFGLEAFRPGQQEAILSLLKHRRLLFVAPTGGGKSLVYQLPATFLGGTTLVVSPLIALMQDQVGALAELGVAATYLAATLDEDEHFQRLRGLRSGQYQIAYVSPERLTFPGFRALLSELRCPLVAIDEAHCISEWGHDFRPEYQRIPEALAQLGSPMVLACTATATPIVRDEILAKLGLPADTPQLLKGFARPNLALTVREPETKKQRQALTDAALREALDRPASNNGTAIIYAPTRRETEAEAARLAKIGWSVAAYHAGLDGQRRRAAQAQFAVGGLELVVATCAFGMGIDRADVRAVIHLAPPGSIESYYQEVGRAGRDGEPAIGLLFTASSDLPRRRSLLERDSDDGPPDQAVVEHKWNLFLELMRWAEGGACRHDAILRYFGDEAERLGGCKRCDVCTTNQDTDPTDAEEVTLTVRKALSAIARIHGRFGLSAAVSLLVGKDDERLRWSGLADTKTFGVLSGESERWVMSLLRRCINAGWVSFHGGDRPLAVLTSSGNAVMKAELPARLVLPPRACAGHQSGKNRAPRNTGDNLGQRGEAEVIAPLDPHQTALFEALRAFRLERAKRDGVPPYVVASDRTLRDLVHLQPRTIDEIQSAHGIGPAKATRYGAALLEVLSANKGAAPVDRSE